jgi:hypothetical protein
MVCKQPLRIQTIIIASHVLKPRVDQMVVPLGTENLLAALFLRVIVSPCRQRQGGFKKTQEQRNYREKVVPIVASLKKI